MPERTLFDRFLDPPPGRTPDVDLPTYRLVSGLLLVLCVIPLVYGAINIWLDPPFFAVMVCIAVAALFFLLAFLLHRRGRTQQAVRLFLGAFLISVLVAVPVAPPGSGVLQQYVLIVPVLLAAALLPARHAGLLAGMGLLGMLVVDLLAPPASWPLLVPPLSFYILTSAIVLVLIRYRDQLEATRRAELAAREERYRLLSENAPDIIFRFRLQPPLGFEYLSPAVERVAGIPLEDLYRDPSLLWELVHPEDREELLICFQTLSTDNLPLRWLLPNGRLVWLEVRIRLIQDGEGLPVAVEGVARDVTDRVQAQQALQKQAHRTEQLLQTTMDGYILVDVEGNIRDVNAAYCAMTGYRREELLTMNIRQLEAALDPSEVEACIERIVRQGADRFETSHYTRDGHAIDLDVSATVLQEEDGPLVAAFVRDVSDRKRLIARLQLLHQIDRATREAQTPHEIAQRALDRLLTLIPAQRALVSLYDLEAQEVEVLALTGMEDTPMRVGMRVPRQFAEDLLARLGQEYQVDDLETLEMLQPYEQVIARLGVRSYMVVPMTADGQVVGTFTLLSERPQVFQEEHCMIVREVAGAVSIALRQSALLEREKRTRRMAERIQQANQVLSRSLDLDEVLSSLLTVLADLVPYDTANVMLLERDGSLRVTYGRGYDRWTDSEQIRRITFQAQQDEKFKHMVLKRESILIPDTTRDERWERLPGTEYIRCWMGVPLVAGGRVLGVYSLDSATPFALTEEHRTLAEALAAPAAVAIQNALLYRELEETILSLEQRVKERTAELEARHLESRRLNRALLNVLDDLNATVERLTRTAAELHQANADLETFAYSLSHDLRAPLRAMQGFALALLEDYGDCLGALGREYAERIARAAEQMDELITDLRTYSQVSRWEMRPQTVFLDKVVTQALEALADAIQAADAELRVEGQLPAVRGYASTLRMVVTNLLSNAIKFVAPGAKPQVRLWADRLGDRVRLWVEDNGIGIPEEHLERIFRPFERLHGIEAYPGTGIGLAIVQRGVERMGGRIGVESEPGRGSRFWIELPSA